MHLINNKLFCEKISLTNHLYLIESNLYAKVLIIC
jgi:hypothetical protein